MVAVAEEEEVEEGDKLESMEIDLAKLVNFNCEKSFELSV